MFVLTGIPLFVCCLFCIAVTGYMVGRITIKGISLGSAGVFVMSLVFGGLFGSSLAKQMVSGGVSFTGNALKLVENIGLVLFVVAVGLTAGPGFFSNLKKNFRSYVAIGLIITISSGLVCAACYWAGRGAHQDKKEFVAIMAGLLSGALTSTPAFSAAKATALPQYENAVTVGYGIAYLFGVIGVVLFVQLMPKIGKADISEEVRYLSEEIPLMKTDKAKHDFKMDPSGLFVVGLCAVLGILVGTIKVPLSAKGFHGPTFSLTTTGGCLLVSLVFGHMGAIGTCSLEVDKKNLAMIRELGLMLFLIGAGVSGGMNFVKYFRPVYFVYGAIMTIVPMCLAFAFAKYVVKLRILDNLGSITGGMTSTPALGALIGLAKTDLVAASYAATYPIALLTIVIVTQMVIVLL